MREPQPSHAAGSGLHDERNVLKNGLYNTISTVIRLGLGIWTVPVLIRLIGLEEYGLWTLTFAAVGVVTLAEAGLSVATTVFVARDLANQDRDGLSQTLTMTVGMMLAMATLALLVLSLGANVIVRWFGQLSPTQRLIVADTLRLSGIVVWTQLLQRIAVGIEQAYQRYGLLSVLNTVQAVFTNVGLLVIAARGGRTVALMSWYALVGVGLLAVHGVIVWRLIRIWQPRLRWHGAKGRAVARYSLAAWVGSLGGVLFGQCDRLLVGNLLGTTTLGVYAAITNLAVQINTLSAVPVQPLLPLLSSLTNQAEVQLSLIKGRIKAALAINSCVALGLGAALFSFAGPLLELLLRGQMRPEYVPALQLAALIYAVYSLNAVGYYILFGIHAVQTYSKIQVAGGFGALVLIGLGARWGGLLGAVAGNAGFWGTWLFMFVGMRRLDIDLHTWLPWLSFPGAWFVVTLAASWMSVQYPIAHLVLFVLLGMILIAWFGINQRQEIASLIHKV